MRKAQLFLIFIISWPTYSAERVALIIGNESYKSAPLANPVSDAKAVGNTLKRMGFSVISSYNANSTEMNKTIDKFGQQAEKAKVALVFYAGHGIQVAGKNYLIPTDIVPKKHRDLYKLLGLNRVMNEAGHASQLGVVILDACRDNPFGNALQANLGRSFVGRGLARVQFTANNVMVSFATSEGKIALDGSKGKHSPYTSAILANLEKEYDIRKILGQVRDDVRKDTHGKQTPFVYGSLGGRQLLFN